MLSITVADVIVKQLELANVRRIYGLIGDSLNAFGQAVKESSLEWIGVRHEETAAYAAAGEAGQTGTLGVCAGTCGPGSIHLINGLYEANRNGVPVLAIVSHIPSAEMGLEYFQATHPDRVFTDCSVFCETLVNPKQLPRLLFAAIEAALNQKGVAVLVIPGDIMAAEFSQMPLLRAPVIAEAVLTPVPEKIKELSALLNEHSKIAFYCGYGCKNAVPEVLALADKLKSPIMYTIRSCEFMALNNPYAVGMNGYLSTGSANYAIHECDCLVLLGTDFPFDPLLPTNPTLIQIDENAAHLGRRCRLDFGLAADMKKTLEMLNPLIDNKTDDSYLKQSLSQAQKVADNLSQQLKQNALSKEWVEPDFLTSVASQQAAEDAVFVIDVGLNDKWAARYIQPKPVRQITGSFKHGTMSAAIGEAIGICFAKPDRQVIALVGDGGVSMLLGDLLTIAQYQLPIHIVVYNNGELGYINFEATLEGYEPFGTKLHNPDFSKVADAIGIQGFHIQNSLEVENVLSKAFEQNKPVLIDAVTNPNALGVIK